nr:SRPBCC family protein [Collimonas antrihumi]
MDINKSTDRIETEIVLKAARSRVWRALSNAEEFGDWFGVALQGKTFVAGQAVQGQITYPGYQHLTWEVVIERMVPEQLLSFRWHPYAVDTAIDYSQEPTTLVVFELTAVEDGALLRVAESGFDNIPAERRQEAFRMNSGGWEAQMKNIEKYVAAAVTS